MYALRGATSVPRDDAAEIQSASAQLVEQLLLRNGITPGDVLSAFFTSTPDLISAFPAAGARRAGFEAVPMLCAQEIPVPDAPRRIVRVMLHVDGSPRSTVQHVYLGEAVKLRPDLASPGN